MENEILVAKQEDTKRLFAEMCESPSVKNVKINISEEEPSLQDVFNSRLSIDFPTGPCASAQLCFRPYKKTTKICILVIIWLTCSIVLTMKNERVQQMHQISIPKDAVKVYSITETPTQNKVKIILEGALLPAYYANLSVHTMLVWVELIITRKKLKGNTVMVLEDRDVLQVVNISKIWNIPIVSEKLIGRVPEVKHKNTFDVASFNLSDNFYFLKVKLATNLKANFPVSLGYDLDPISVDDGIVYAALVLLMLYLLIILNIVNRTLAAMLGSTMSIAILAALNARPTMAEILSWIDIDSLLLLFSMMTIVSILGETGIFDYLAIFAFKLTKGQIWPLITTLCLFTAICSCFLDNVTTALLMTPVTIRLCQVMKLNPVPVLMSLLIFSNIGGAITPIGDPPNVIIASNPDVIKSGINFTVFTLHMSIGVILSLIAVYFQLRFVYRNSEHLRFSEPKDLQILKREIAVWRRVAASMSSYSKEEECIKKSLTEKARKLMGRLRRKLSNNDSTKESPKKRKKQQNIEKRKGCTSVCLGPLEDKYFIKDKVLLVKCGITLSLVIVIFFLHSIPAISRLGLGWTALLGALLLLLLCSEKDVESILARIEWATLLFFASLFILMEALARLGLIDWIGKQTQIVIMSVDHDNRLAVAILLILWVSAIASAFVDNIPLCSMMVRIATSLADDQELNLPLQPLIWALSFGACLGGNGTLFGSSSNIVCAGVAESHGYKLSFLDFMKVGFPAMITSMIIVSIYLMIAHVALQWH